ncbi:restriction endonuclease subunit S [Paratractidigestivibacter sp.]|uniref:restriction endonuclease subunit S n=1 Tax=Paratractidigestivibacter sp. TaxID=2847316 RepID=UPI0040275D19
MITLSEVADIQTGPFGSQLHKEDYVAEGTPIVTVEHLGGRFFTRQNLPFVDDDDAERLKKYRMKQGDIIYSRVGSVDRCSYAEEENEGWLFSGRCLRVRPKCEINSEFLYYYLSSKEVKRFVEGIAVGATMPSINTALMGEIPIPDLPAHQQAFIAAVMTPIDRKIAINAKINGYLEELLLAKYDDLFPESGPYDGTLADIGEVVGGATPSKKRPEYYCQDGIGWVTPRDLSNANDKFLSRGADDITEEGYNSCSAKLMPKGSVLFSSRAPIGYVAIAANEVATNQGFKSVVPNKSIGTAFTYCFLVRNKQRIADMGAGTTFPEVSSKIMKSVKLTIPRPGECKAFSAFANPLLYQQYLLETEGNKLAALRDTLLPKLMSGEIDVSKVDLKQLNSHLSDC